LVLPEKALPATEAARVLVERYAVLSKMGAWATLLLSVVVRAVVVDDDSKPARACMYQFSLLVPESERLLRGRSTPLRPSVDAID